MAWLREGVKVAQADAVAAAFGTEAEQMAERGCRYGPGIAAVAAAVACRAGYA